MSMTVLLYLTEPRAAKVAWRIDQRKRFSVSVPDGAVRLARRWRLCLVISPRPIVVEDGDAVLDADVAGGPFVVAVARVRGSPRSTTTDDRLIVGRPYLLHEGPVPLSELARVLPGGLRSPLRGLPGAVARDVGEEATDPFRTALDTVQGGLGQVIDDLLPTDEQEPIDGAPGEVLALERDAVKLALEIVGLDVDLEDEWDSVAQGYLQSLAYEPRESSLVNYDATRFPDYTVIGGERPDWLLFGRGGRHLRIAQVDSTPLERKLGVDLIYRHVENDAFVLVQYKRMVKDDKGDRWYRPDGQLSAELDRMRAVGGGAQAGRAPDPPTWRLHPQACFVKLVAPPPVFDPTSDRLLPGIYLPLLYLEELLANDVTRGPKGGRRLGYDNVDRYLTTGLFTSLVREGWVGSSGITTGAIRMLVEASLGRDRSVIIAEESGFATGAQRRAGRRR